MQWSNEWVRHTLKTYYICLQIIQNFVECFESSPPNLRVHQIYPLPLKCQLTDDIEATCVFHSGDTSANVHSRRLGSQYSKKQFAWKICMKLDDLFGKASSTNQHSSSLFRVHHFLWVEYAGRERTMLREMSIGPLEHAYVVRTPSLTWH
jgi:hypothetical protein